MQVRPCSGTTRDGGPCRASPLRGESTCVFHSPEHQEEVAEGRRLGGLRRRREKTLASAYDIESLTSVAALRRLLEIAAFDTLALENSLARSRTLVAVVTAGSRLLEVGELEARIALLEAAMARDQRSDRAIALVGELAMRATSRDT